MVKDPGPPDVVAIVEHGVLERKDDGTGYEQERQLENLIEARTKDRREHAFDQKRNGIRLV